MCARPSIEDMSMACPRAVRAYTRYASESQRPHRRSRCGGAPLAANSVAPPTRSDRPEKERACAPSPAAHTADRTACEMAACESGCPGESEKRGA
jgi:hypothetical protein